MLLWVSLFGIVALTLFVGALIISMARAERRARRSLYLALGLSEPTVDFLMTRNRDVLTELNYVRSEGEAKIWRESFPDEGNIVTFRSDRRVGRSGRKPPILGGDLTPSGRGRQRPDRHTRH